MANQLSAHIARGIRAGLGAVVPSLIGVLYHSTGASWAGLTGFTVAVSDKGGGAYRTRAVNMITLTLFTALAGALGGIAGRYDAFAIPFTLLFVTACSYAYALGDNAASIGTSTAVAFVIALAAPVTSLTDALMRAGLLILGGMWSMLLSLGLWPIRVYRPAREAVAAAYNAVADFADKLARHDPVQHAPVRSALEDARGTLADLRRGRAGESARGERLLVLLESADRIFVTLIALAHVLEEVAADDAARAEAVTSASDVARELRAVATQMV